MIDWSYGAGIIVGIIWGEALFSSSTRNRLDRWFRPRKVRREYRAGIKQAQSILRLIASTHYFEDNLDQTIGSFIPRGDDHYIRAFKAHYWHRAAALYDTQRAWRGAVKPQIDNGRTGW